MSVPLRSLVSAAAILILPACRDDSSPLQPSSPALSTAAATALAFRQVSAGLHTCGVTTSSRAYCWGEGPLGDGTETQRLRPVAVAGGLTFSQVDAGGGHTCGKTPGGVAYCWGSNIYGRLGDGTTITRLTPTPVVGPL